MNSEGGYNSDARTAHRFTREEAEKCTGNGDIAIPIDKLGLSEECENVTNLYLRCLVEKGTLNQLYDLKMKAKKGKKFANEE